jgi:GT2 family glycosyltransferase
VRPGNKIVFLADVFADEIPGGGELNNKEVIDLLACAGYDVIRRKCSKVTSKFILEHSDHPFVVANFIDLPANCIEVLKTLRYVIYEHDHKYLSHRNPALYPNLTAGPRDLRYYYFYKNARAILCQSRLHEKILRDNLGLSNVINLGGNVWSLSTLEKLREISKKNKREKYSVMDSPVGHKNTQGAINFCNNKDLEYELISDPTHDDFLKKMGKNKGFVFFPKTPETLSRVVVEARMAGASVVTNELVGAYSEDWIKMKGGRLVDLMISKRDEIVGHLLRALKRPIEPSPNPRISIISTFHKGEEFLEGFLENITAQTIFTDCELILIDSDSPGKEEFIISPYLSRYPNITHHRLPENKSITRCLNLGAQMAKGEFLTFGFIDDRKKSDCLEILSKNLMDSPEIDLVYGDVFETNVPNESFTQNSSGGTLFDHSTYPFSRENMVRCLPGPMPLWRKHLHDQCGFFDSDNCNFADDWEMWLRMVSSGSKFKKIDETVGLYYSKGRSTQSHNLPQKQEEAAVFFHYKPLFGPNFDRFAPHFSQFLPNQ